jgi:hypothetical protein
VAKGAVHIASVGDLYVNLVVHLVPFLKKQKVPVLPK